jgi:hypothetical protein
MMFRVLLAIDIAAAAVVGYFFLVGLADGSVSAFNIELWTVILLGIAAVFAVGFVLRRAGRPVLACLILAILAVPALLYGLFLLVVILSGARWN